MKNKTKGPTHAERRLTNAHALGFRDGCETTATLLRGAVRRLGLRAVADELERQHSIVYRELGLSPHPAAKDFPCGRYAAKAKPSKEARALARVTRAFKAVLRAEAKVERKAGALARRIRILRRVAAAAESILPAPTEQEELLVAVASVELARRRFRRALREVSS